MAVRDYRERALLYADGATVAMGWPARLNDEDPSPARAERGARYLRPWVGCIELPEDNLDSNRTAFDWQESTRYADCVHAVRMHRLVEVQHRNAAVTSAVHRR